MVPITDEEMTNIKATRDQQLNAVLTTLYFVVESGRKQIAKGAVGTIRQAIGMIRIQNTCELANISCIQLPSILISCNIWLN